MGRVIRVSRWLLCCISSQLLTFQIGGIIILFVYLTVVSNHSMTMSASLLQMVVLQQQ